MRENASLQNKDILSAPVVKNILNHKIFLQIANEIRKQREDN